VDQQPLPLPGKNPGLLLIFHAQLDRKQMLGPRFVSLQPHGFNLPFIVFMDSRRPAQSVPGVIALSFRP
jgi:hypothetical protein